MPHNVKMTGTRLRAEGVAGVCPCRLTCYASLHPLEPVVRAARVIPDGEDYDLVGMLTKDDGKGKTFHPDATTVKVFRPACLR